MNSSKMFIFSIVFVPTYTLRLLEDSHSNSQDLCEDFRYDGMELPIAEVIIGEKTFNSRNCGEMVPIDEVNKDIPVVKFSQVRSIRFAVFILFNSSSLPEAQKWRKHEKRREKSKRHLLENYTLWNYYRRGFIWMDTI